MPHINHLGTLYGLSTTSNAELRYRFYILALTDSSVPENKGVATQAARWVVGEEEGLGKGKIQGRMKFCRPVLKAANKANPEETKKLFEEHKSAFHPIARRLLLKVKTAWDLVSTV